jgi:hypothetical protein
MASVSATINSTVSQCGVEASQRIASPPVLSPAVSLAEPAKTWPMSRQACKSMALLTCGWPWRATMQ